MTELKPCPWCDETELELTHGTPDREGTPYQIICTGCGALGPQVFITNHSSHENDKLNRHLAGSHWNYPRSAHPGDTFVGPDGEKLIAVPMEPTRKMFER